MGTTVLQGRTASTKMVREYFSPGVYRGVAYGAGLNAEADGTSVIKSLEMAMKMVAMGHCKDAVASISLLR